MMAGSNPIFAIQMALNPHEKRYPKATSGQNVFRVGLLGALVGGFAYLYASGRRESVPPSRGR